MSGLFVLLRDNVSDRPTKVEASKTNPSGTIF